MLRASVFSKTGESILVNIGFGGLPLPISMDGVAFINSCFDPYVKDTNELLVSNAERFGNSWRQ